MVAINTWPSARRLARRFVQVGSLITPLKIGAWKPVWEFVTRFSSPHGSISKKSTKVMAHQGHGSPSSCLGGVSLQALHSTGAPNLVSALNQARFALIG